MCSQRLDITDQLRYHIPMSRETDLAWAAGFWDGEGCVSLSYRQYSENTPKIPRIVVQIAQIDTRVLKRFQNIVGYGNILGPYKPKNKNSKPYWVWRVEGNLHLKSIREMLSPYLDEIKLHQMDRALNARKEWEDNAVCLVHNTRLEQVSSGGRWRCRACLSDAGKKRARVMWPSKEGD